MLGALALVLGISQCKKQESPVQAGEKQYIEVTASNGNDGSKVNVDFASVPTVMNLTWEEGDVITVSGGAEGTLTLDEGVGTAQGHFSGEIKKMNDNELVFSYKKAVQERGDENPNLPDFSAQDGTETWIENTLYLETKAAYNDNGKYSLQMEMPYAVLMLNLSAFVGTQNDVTIKAGDVPVVTFESLEKDDAEEMFVAVPADGTEQTYAFSGNGRTVEKTWELAASTYYTAEGGNAVVIKPFLFSVAEGVTVEFAPGNLWYGTAAGESTPAFHFEKNQWDYSLGGPIEPGYSYCWDPNHVSHFYWSNTTDWQASGMEPYAKDFSCSTEETDDVFFTEAPGFQVEGEDAGAWRTLSKAEWEYLLGFAPGQWAQTESYGRPGAKAKSAFKDLGGGVSGLVILPDDADASVMESITSTSDLATYGAVFFPTVGIRYGTSVEGVGMGNFYWLSTPGEDYGVVCGVYFDSGGNVSMSNCIYRSFGSPVRLVR